MFSTDTMTCYNLNQFLPHKNNYFKQTRPGAYHISIKQLFRRSDTGYLRAFIKQHAKRSKLLFFFGLLVIFTSGCSNSDRKVPNRNENNLRPYGKWIVTKCISGNIEDPRIGLDEIARNLGGTMEIKKHTIKHKLNGNSESTDNLSPTLTVIAAQMYCPYCDDVKGTNDAEGRVAKYIGCRKDSLNVICTTEDSYLSEIPMLSNNQILLAVDGFFLYMNRYNDKIHSVVIIDKLPLYTDESMTSKLNYYIIKGDKVVVYLKLGTVSFIEYSNNGKEYYGWVYASGLS